MRFTLFWEALATPASSYTVFTHIVADDPAQKIGQLDQRPVAGQHPTPTWRRGDLFTDPYAVPIDPNTRPGSYRVIVGDRDAGASADNSVESRTAGTSTSRGHWNVCR